MPSRRGEQLSEIVMKNVDEMIKVCAAVDEVTASRAPGDRWSPKEIISHLCGPEGVGFVPVFKMFLDQDMPRLDLKPEDPFFTERRAAMSFRELLGEFRQEYVRLADFARELSEEDLLRKAHVPMLKETPLTEHPILEAFLSAMTDHHLVFHINHMKEILGALGREA